MGMVKGWFDIEIVLPGGQVWFLEVKEDDKAKLTDEQKELGDRFTEMGVKWAVVRSLSEAADYIERWREESQVLIPFRGQIR